MTVRPYVAFAGATLLCTAVLAAPPPAAPAAKPAPGAKAPVAKTELTWWGHAAWVIKTPAGTTIAIDPWFQNPKAPKDAQWPQAVDAILVTHGHMDHVGNAVELAKKTGAQVIGSYELTNLIAPDSQIPGGNAGGSFVVKDVTIHLVGAVHSSGYSADGKSAPQYAGDAMGYVLQIAGGPTIYHAGDTGLFKDMELIGEVFKPTISLLPIGGHFTMDPLLAAQAAKMLKSKTIIPMHFGTFPLLKGTPDELRAAMKKTAPAAVVLEFQPGETKAL